MLFSALEIHKKRRDGDPLSTDFMWEKADEGKIHRTGSGSLTREVCSQAHALEAGAVRQYLSKASQKRKPTTWEQRDNFQQSFLISLHGNLKNWRICLLFICSTKITNDGGLRLILLFVMWHLASHTYLQP